ncbi:MAG: hypothetical protein ACI8PZ_003807 [Myxococcota bacterium]
MDVSFEVRFPTTVQPMERDTLSAWLLERGEPATVDAEVVALKALPVVFATVDELLCARLQITASLPLTRLVDMLFDLSMEVGSDVELQGAGQVTRAKLWLTLADEQDRIRLGEALERAKEHSNCMEVLRRLWSVVNSLREGHDDRWDAAARQIVEMREVGEGISVEAARGYGDDPAVGDEVAVPVAGHLHTLAWRWFSDSYPGLAESQHTLH